MPRLAALRATAHPLRLRLLSLLTGTAMSASEAARELGEQQANVSYHLRTLERAALVEVVETARVRGGLAKRYRAVPPAAPADRDPVPPVAGGEEREATEAFTAAMASELQRRTADRRPGVQVFADAEVWVDPAVWQEVVSLVERASRLLHRSATAPRTPGTTAVTMSAALFELERP